MHDNFILKKNIFFHQYFKKFLQLEKYSRWKINIQSIFGQHKILYKKIKKKFDFRNTLNHFIFQKFIPRIYDVVHYKNFFRDHNNLVILKKRKKI
jgi:hypothetical protein